VVAQSNALQAFGGAPQLSVVDNAKATIAKALIYEPAVQRTYAEFCDHYGMAALNTRVRRPKDKPRPRSASRSCSAGSWRGSATGASPRWPS